jgi:hypothetical protein
MAKIHTRQKRNLDMFGVRGRDRKPRPKTFKTKEKAIKYAEVKGMKNYKLVDLQELNPNKSKIKIVIE